MLLFSPPHMLLRPPAPALLASLCPRGGMALAGTRSRLAKNVAVHNEPKDGS